MIYFTGPNKKQHPLFLAIGEFSIGTQTVFPLSECIRLDVLHLIEGFMAGCYKDNKMLVWNISIPQYPIFQVKGLCQIQFSAVKTLLFPSLTNCIIESTEFHFLHQNIMQSGHWYPTLFTLSNFVGIRLDALGEFLKVSTTENCFSSNKMN